MSYSSRTWPASAAIPILLFVPVVALAGFSVDETPTETPADPGDVFLPGLVCDMDDGDGSCPVGTPSLNVPSPGPDQDPTFDMDAHAIDLPLLVCPPQPPFIPGILFSFDDGDGGPGVGPPDNATEIFLYDHCRFLAAQRMSYYTSITESVLGLLGNPPPPAADDDVDAFDTRQAAPAYESGVTILFSPDHPSTGGLGTPNPQAHVWSVDLFTPAPVIWADAALHIGVPDPDDCDIDGIAPVDEPDLEWRLLFTTDAEADCGLDPGDIWVSDLAGTVARYADDVADLKIAVNEIQEVDIDALAINDGGNFDITDPYDPPDATVYKADWPNYAPSGMPDFSQDHTGFPPTFCGPTAMADSLWWFDSEMECDRDLTDGDSSETEPNDIPADADRLGERPEIPGNFSSDSDVDWYVFDIPGMPYRICEVTVSTCVFRQPGDANTHIALHHDPPGTAIAANDDGCLPDLQSELTARVPAGSRYYVEVTSRPGPSITGAYTLSLGIDCYRMVERYPGSPDDHSEYNPVELIPDLAFCMNTDDVQGTGSGHRGTRIPEMQVCFDDYSTQKGLRRLYEDVVALMPPFDEVAREIERSEDVLLLLGFWWDNGGTWTRCGGHYVTSAGVDFDSQTITLSDPGLNNAETGAPGQVRGPDHADHAPAVNPPPDHDDTRNVSHDRYEIGPSNVPAVSQFSLPAYATNGTPTSCHDVARWCILGLDWGQNPAEPPVSMDPCPVPDIPVSTEVEAMFDVSPQQTPICVYLDSTVPWPDNLRIEKAPCNVALDNVPKDLIRGKLCNLRFADFVPQVDLGWVQCLYDDSVLTRFNELSPDDTRCVGGWFYLIRQSTDAHYGQAWPGGEFRVPFAGGCP